MGAIYNNWQLSGWLYHDIFVTGAAVVFVILCLLFVSSLIKRRSAKRLIPWILVLVVYGAIVNFIGVVFFGMFRTVDFEGQSQLFYSKQTQGLTSIERMIIPNGHSDGISTSTSLFEIISVNSQTGEPIWSKRTDWRNYLIGQTSQYVIVNDADDDALYLLDAKTGKQRFSQADLIRKIPQLSEILSSNFNDYRFISHRLYLYGLNNRYFQLDLDNWTLTEDPNIKTLFQQHTAPEWMVTASKNKIGQPIEDQELSEALDRLGEKLINPVLLGKKQAHQYYVFAYKKRRSPLASVGLYDMDKQTYLWQTPVTLTQEDVPVNAWQVDDALYLRVPRYLYKIELNTGKLGYQFDYRWNRVVER